MASKMNEVGIYKLNKNVDDVKIVYGDKLEIKAFLPAGEMVLVYNHQNKQRTIMSKHIESQNRDCIIIDPNDRVMIPTGLIVDKPANFNESITANPELYWKYGLTLHHDFVEHNKQLYVCLLNSSGTRVLLENKDVIAYLRMQPQTALKVTNVRKKPK